MRDEQHPGGEIAIKFTGLRPGEKLYEELLIGDHPLPTAHPRILRAREEHLAWPQLHALLQSLQAAADLNDEEAIRHLLGQLVQGYKPHASPKPC